MATEIVRSPKATRVADISPDAFDSMSPAGQHHYLVECAIRHLPARNSTDESRRCLNQLLDMFADTLDAEREREAERKLESEMRARLGPDDFVEFCRMAPDCLPTVRKDAGTGLRLVWSASAVEA